MPATVFYDADCGFCTRSIAVMRRCDWLGLLRAVPLQSAEARGRELPEAKTLSQMVLCTTRRCHGGWLGVKQVLLRVPLFWLCAAGITLASPWAGLALLLVLSPLGNPVGQAAYRWVARNRHRLPGSTCSLENR